LLKYSISLRRLILWLCVLSVVGATANSLYVGYRLQHDVLIASTLESNRAYAAKLADTASSMLTNADRMLEYGAHILGQDPGVRTARAEVERIWQQTNYFNSVIVVDEHGVVRDSAPPTADLIGKKLDSQGARTALQARSSLISSPFVSTTGRWTASVSHPVFSNDGVYRGFISGAIFLHESNILHNLLSAQTHRDGSYVYVVGEAGTLLYHPDPSRIGQRVAGRNAVVDRVLAGESGAAETRNSLGVEMLAGFAAVPHADWGVVVQRSRQSTLARLDSLLWRAVRNSLPWLGALLAGVWVLSAMIARPLSRMASLVLHVDTRTAGEQLEGVRAWYFEAAQLRRALIAGLTSLHGVITTLRESSLTDALTGLLNRRGLDAVIEKLQEDGGLSFGVLIADIDHFKRVNDTHGHAMGDAVLQRFSALMRENARDTDVLGRVGGEEFVMLLPNSTMAQTEAVAQRLRLSVQNAEMPHAETLTVSIGISHCYELASSPGMALRDADGALYGAKQGGRNRVHVAGRVGQQEAPTE
jgi:diguanylate cyclase (GGDEF)-like protein